MNSETRDLTEAAQRIRHHVLDVAKRANVGHIGSALSVADIIAVVYGTALRGLGPDDPDRDRFVLSKGHAALALYAGLVERGWLTESELLTYCTDGTCVATHPESVVSGIDFSSGSLGQGLPVGVGAALAARMSGSSRRTFILLSDAECDAGSTWEAALFAGHHRLGSLTAVVDVNGQQAFGYTADVLDLEPLADKWAAFGWNVREVNGHDIDDLSGSIAVQSPDHPTVVLARTRLGRGVSFMEGKIKWHYWPLSDEEYAAAKTEVSKGLQ